MTRFFIVLAAGAAAMTGCGQTSATGQSSQAARIAGLHSYDVPAIAVWPVESDWPAYADWVEAEG